MTHLQMNEELKKEARKALNKELDKVETKKGTIDGFFAIGSFLDDWIDRASKETVAKVVEFLSHDMDFKDEAQRKAAVKMYIDEFKL